MENMRRHVWTCREHWYCCTLCGSEVAESNPHVSGLHNAAQHLSHSDYRHPLFLYTFIHGRNRFGFKHKACSLGKWVCLTWNNFCIAHDAAQPVYGVARLENQEVLEAQDLEGVFFAKDPEVRVSEVSWWDIMCTSLYARHSNVVAVSWLNKMYELMFLAI